VVLIKKNEKNLQMQYYTTDLILFKRKERRMGSNFSEKQFNAGALYRYQGSVKSFDTVLNSNWDGGYTRAKSEKQALNNFKFRYRQHRGLAMDSKLTLNPNGLTIEGEG
jgi:hypothetical protein